MTAKRKRPIPLKYQLEDAKSEISMLLRKLEALQEELRAERMLQQRLAQTYSYRGYLQ